MLRSLVDALLDATVIDPKEKGDVACAETPTSLAQTFLVHCVLDFVLSSDSSLLMLQRSGHLDLIRTALFVVTHDRPFSVAVPASNSAGIGVTKKREVVVSDLDSGTRDGQDF